MRRYTTVTTQGEAARLWPSLLEGAGRLSDFYLARSDRQQFFLDSAAGATGFGAAGAALSTAAGTQTVQYWSYGALIPVILVNFNANEPTRDLYFSGHIALQLILERYRRLFSRLELLVNDPAGDLSTLRQRCAEADAHLAEVEGWGDGADKAAFLPAVTEVATWCRAILGGEAQLASMAQAADAQSAEWVHGMATDTLNVDSLMVERDQRLRTTPARAFTAAIVAPLRAVDSLLSGTDTQAAVNALATNAVLDNTVVLLHPVRLPAAPSLVGNPVQYPGALQTRATTTRPAAAPGGTSNLPTDAKVREVNDWLRLNTWRIEEARLDLNTRIALARELRDAAGQSQLSFNYDVERRAVSVQIEPRGTTATRTPPPETTPTPPESDTPEAPVQAPPSPAEPPKG